MYSPWQGLFPKTFCLLLAAFGIPDQGGECNGNMTWQVINIPMKTRVTPMQSYTLKWIPGSFNVGNANRMNKALLNN
jgi:hypothetical protein